MAGKVGPTTWLLTLTIQIVSYVRQSFSFALVGVPLSVVGNSIIQGIEFRVDELLAEVAERRGFEVEEIRMVRTKRVGNSIIDSTVRNGNGLNHKAKTQLYDAALVLRS